MPTHDVWALSASSSPAARAGLWALLGVDASIRPWIDNRVRPGRERDVDRAPGFLHQPLAPDVIIVVMATDDTTLQRAISSWDTAALVMLGGDPSLALRVSPARSLAVLGIETEASPLAAAIHAVAAGLTVVDPTMLDPERGLGGGIRRSAADRDGDVLTPRERQVLALVAAGLPNKTIAMELGISEHTAKFHVGSLLTKLGAASRTEAVTLAARRGILII